MSSVLIDKIASALFPSQEASYTVVAAATVRRRMAHGLLEAEAPPGGVTLETPARHSSTPASDTSSRAVAPGRDACA